MIDVEGESIDDVAESLLKVGVRKALPQGVVKDLQVGVEGVLVHGVDGCQVRQHEEQDGSTTGRRSVAISEDFNLLGRLLCLLQLLHHLPAQVTAFILYSYIYIYYTYTQAQLCALCTYVC